MQNEHSGLYEFYARAYDPVTGTWMQQDTYRGEIMDPMSLHRYGYVGNSPVNYYDIYGFLATASECAEVGLDYYSCNAREFEDSGINSAAELEIIENSLYEKYPPGDYYEEYIFERYMIGDPQRPDGSTPLVGIPGHDAGFSGDTQSATIGDYLSGSLWWTGATLSFTGSVFGIGDGAEAYSDYWYGNGKNQDIDISDFFLNDKSGQIGYNNLVTDAQRASEELYRHCEAEGLNECSITSGVYTFGLRDKKNPLFSIYPNESIRFPYPETMNWQRTYGSFYLWNSGTLTATCTDEGIRYRLEFTVHAEDRYNFNPGEKAVGWRSTDDSVNGRWEQLGWANPYMNYSTYTQVIEWNEGDYENRNIY